VCVFVCRGGRSQREIEDNTSYVFSFPWADCIANYGGVSELANYGEYSGNPNNYLTFEYAQCIVKLLLMHPHPDGKVCCAMLFSFLFSFRLFFLFSLPSSLLFSSLLFSSLLFSSLLFSLSFLFFSTLFPSLYPFFSFLFFSPSTNENTHFTRARVFASFLTRESAAADCGRWHRQLHGRGRDVQGLDMVVVLVWIWRLLWVRCGFGLVWCAFGDCCVFGGCCVSVWVLGSVVVFARRSRFGEL
jgi:hypothetical protein